LPAAGENIGDLFPEGIQLGRNFPKADGEG